MDWKDINKETPNEDIESCEVKLDDGEIIEAEYFPKEEQFQVMYGNYYYIRKSDNWREFNICKQKFTGKKATHWRIYNKSNKNE